jgi:hypothetical protein
MYIYVYVWVDGLVSGSFDVATRRCVVFQNEAMMQEDIYIYTYGMYHTDKPLFVWSNEQYIYVVPHPHIERVF